MLASILFIDFNVNVYRLYRFKEQDQMAKQVDKKIHKK